MNGDYERGRAQVGLVGLVDGIGLQLWGVQPWLHPGATPAALHAAQVIGRFNFYIISFLSALKRFLTAQHLREALGGFADVLGMLLLLGDVRPLG